MIYLPVTFMSKPEDIDHLVAYYAMSRPIGFWGPVRKEAERQGLIPTTWYLGSEIKSSPLPSYSHGAPHICGHRPLLFCTEKSY